MAKLTKYVPNRSGIRSILKSPAVDVVLLKIGREVKARAEATNQIMEKDSPNDRGVPLQYRVINANNTIRSRVRVIADHPGAINAEHKHHILLRSLYSV